MPRERPRKSLSLSPKSIDAIQETRDRLAASNDSEAADRLIEEGIKAIKTKGQPKVPTSVSAAVFRKARELQGYSQRYLAELVGVSEQTVWRLENGGNTSRVNLIRIARVLGLSGFGNEEIGGNSGEGS